MPRGSHRPICSVPDCGNLNYRQKCCYEHWCQIRRESFGELAAFLGFERCSNPKCGRTSISREGICQKCYRRFIKHGDVDIVLPKNEQATSPIGYEIISDNGTVYKKQPQHKLANKLGYVRKAILVWESETGDICVKEDRFSYKDGDYSNADISNIVLIPKKRTIKTCKNCGKGFPFRNRNSSIRKFCSYKCHGKSREGKRSSVALFSDEEVKSIRNRIYLGENKELINKEKGVDRKTINNLVNGKTYADVPFPPY